MEPKYIAEKLIEVLMTAPSKNMLRHTRSFKLLIIMIRILF